ncbi:hypothetical protein C0Q70_12901 [Pomacea canaliculata]|uniref:Uncharacterized protein n=1 Tax=Pomacea canaliculata TaxID=400727 RepID=A0A2T7P2S6_POMCA|nr:hypothetical protein C0Q70_12901 [Pomacea canaliculata]
MLLEYSLDAGKLINSLSIAKIQFSKEARTEIHGDTRWHKKKSKSSHESRERKLSDMVPTSLARCCFDNINEKDGIFETASLPIAYLHTHLPARQGAKAGLEERGRVDEAPGGARYAKWRKRVCGVADVSSIDSRRHFLPIQMESNIQHHGARSGLG